MFFLVAVEWSGVRVDGTMIDRHFGRQITFVLEARDNVNIFCGSFDGESIKT